jgi:hypothetical protein
MLLTLAEARRIAADVAAKQNPALEVVGATVSEGGSRYAEVILTVRGCTKEPCRVVIGVIRDAPEEAFRAEVGKRLGQHLNEHGEILRAVSS